MVTVRAFIIVHFSFALYERYKFYFFLSKFSVFLFSSRGAMGSHALHSSIGLEGKKCAAVEI